MIRPVVTDLARADVLGWAPTVHGRDASAPHGTDGVDVVTPIDEYLRVQQQLTAVDRFASRAADERLHAGTGRWRDRLPATPPAAGQQYAFEVDLDACTGCKACVAACHSLNGLDDGEAWRRVGALRGADEVGRPAVQTVTHACHHCVEPACLDGCPANAYEKDPVTGIVRHLDDACIGCSYCTLTCPYEVPTFNQDLGIVRKCDLCSDRLSVGEAPACVQGCPQGAITVTLVDVAELTAATVAAPADAALVPGAPSSRLTTPTTRYRSRRPLSAALVPDDAELVDPGHGHRPLAVMLTLTQVAVGALVVGGFLTVVDAGPAAATDALGLVGLLTGLVALSASVLHLGRPLLAWRAILGIGHSWLSREILAFGVFAAGAIGASAASVLGLGDEVIASARVVAVVAGIAGVACSAQLYATTGRRWWRWAVTGPRFLATAVVGGTLATASVLALVAPGQDVALVRRLVLVAAVAMVVGLAVPLVALLGGASGSASSDDGRRTTRRLLLGPLRERLGLRIGLGILGAVLLATIAASSLADGSGAIAPGIVLAGATVVAVAGDYHDRRLFFLACVAPRMPGPPR